MINLSKTMANEWAPLRIRVNAVAPGTILAWNNTTNSNCRRR
jgi:NAD(P)-dependent dehydrogenase (short-subunit alcohol dehydrogenase family)